MSRVRIYMQYKIVKYTFGFVKIYNVNMKKVNHSISMMFKVINNEYDKIY